MSNWKKAEKDFESSFDHHGKGAFVFRMKDTAMAKATGGAGAFMAAQPADYLILITGEWFFAEVKSTQDKAHFHFSNIRKQQIAYARRVTGAGGLYLFFIKSEHLNQWFCVPAPVIFTTLRQRKSMPWTDLKDYACEL